MTPTLDQSAQHPGSDNTASGLDAVLDLTVKACTAYGREDFAGRIERSRSARHTQAAHIVVAGEFKQGKSSLVNALVGAAICPVNDDIATAVPTFLRQASPARAEVVYADTIDPDLPPSELSGDEIELADLYRFVTEQRHIADGTEREVKAVNVWLPRRILSGMVLVDTPGVGGLSSTHSTPTMGALPLADAVVFVTDASQELTRAELDFLNRARDACDRIVVALTKTDFYPRWRKILELNEQHIAAAGIKAEVIPVSAPLRSRAVRGNERDLNVESGYPRLVEYLTQDVAGQIVADSENSATREVISVIDQIESQFRHEQAALTSPERAQAIIDELTETKERTEQLRSQAAKWNQTLSDGTADLVADVDHDYRSRTRLLIKDCDAAIDNSDPADTWPEFEPWLYQRVSHDVFENYAYLRNAATDLSELIAQHFRDASGDVLARLAVFNPDSMMTATTIDTTVDTDKMGARSSGFTLLRGSYMGILMFSMLGSMVGIALGPVAVGIGMLMGRKTLRDEKARQLTQRRAQAKNAVRKYTDEVSFHVNKDSRDTLRRVQRQIRDHYSSRAEELHRSTTDALKAANLAAKEHESDRVKRLADTKAELGRLATLRQRAEMLLLEDTP